MTATISHALRAAVVLDGEPYPYVKWLAAAAARRPTGARVGALVNELLELLATGALPIPGPEREHPLNVKLRQIRNLLIAAARSRGIDGPWLQRWYLHLDMRQRIGEARGNAE